MDIQVSSQPRAAAVRAARPRRRAAPPSCSSRFRGVGVGGGPRRSDRFDGRQRRRRRHARRDPRRPRGAPAMLVDPHTAVGIARGPRAAPRPRRADGVPGHRPPGQVPRRRRAGHRDPPAAAGAPGRPVRARGALRRSCRPTWPPSRPTSSRRSSTTRSRGRRSSAEGRRQSRAGGRTWRCTSAAREPSTRLLAAASLIVGAFGLGVGMASSAQAVPPPWAAAADCHRSTPG